MKMSQIRQKNYQVFSGLEPRTLSNQVASLKYIDSLASSAGIDISQWNVLEIFKNGEGRVHTDKKQINKLFFMAAKETPVSEVLETPWIGEVLAMEKTIETRGVNRIRIDLDRAWSRYSEREATLKVELNKIITLRHSLDRALGYSGDSISHQLQRVFNKGFWQFLAVVDGNFLELVTTQPVIISKINKAQGVDIKVDLGHLAMKVGLGEGHISVYRAGEIVLPFRHPHPNVSAHSSPCFGNLQTDVDRALSSADIEELCELMQAFLEQNGESGHPYMSISEMYEKVQAHETLRSLENMPDFDSPEFVGWVRGVAKTFWNRDEFSDELALRCVRAALSIASADASAVMLKKFTPQKFLDVIEVRGAFKNFTGPSSLLEDLTTPSRLVDWFFMNHGVSATQIIGTCWEAISGDSDTGYSFDEATKLKAIKEFYNLTNKERS